MDDLWQIFDEIRRTEAEGAATEETVGCECCKGQRIIVDEGQQICLDCKTVQGCIIDSGAEWRFYGGDDNRDEDPTRCGMPSNDLLPKSSLGSVIGSRRFESKDVRKIRMYQMWNSMPYWERTLHEVFERLATNTVLHGVPSKVLDDAKVLYKRASERKISRGDNRDGLIASSIYYACLINNVPRSTKEVARMFNLDVNILTKGNARFQTLLKMNVKSCSSKDFIARFGTRLRMDCRDIDECKRIAAMLDELEIISENAPMSIAAGVIYFYTMLKGLDINKKDISDACEVSDPTINKCYKRILKWKDFLMKNDPQGNL